MLFRACINRNARLVAELLNMFLKARIGRFCLENVEALVLHIRAFDETMYVLCKIREMLSLKRVPERAKEKGYRREPLLSVYDTHCSLVVIHKKLPMKYCT